MVLDAEAEALSACSKHLVPLAFCWRSITQSATCIVDFHAQDPFVKIKEFAKEMMGQMGPVRMVDDDASTVRADKGIKQGREAFAPRHWHSQTDTVGVK